jgi:sulfate/thiosulfate transport system permease protein
MPASAQASAVGAGLSARAAGGAPRGRSAAASANAARARKIGVRTVALGYLALLLLAPVGMIFYRTFEHGLSAVASAVSTPAALHALVLSLEVAAIAVPLNTAFGIGMALLLERGRPRGRAVLDMLISLPFAISPVVVGLSLILVYGRNGWLGTWFAQHGVHIIFSVPGMVMATAIVSLPFVVRETVPVLRELGTDAEQAAETLGAGPWQIFWRVTLPGIRWGVVYGVVLTTARALGEFGAVSIVSGRIENQTQTLPLYVQDRFENFDATGAYTAALVLALLALSTLLAMNLLTRRRGEAG